MEHWSNLTLRRISEQDAGQYRCIARNKGGQVEANVSLQTPPAPVTILIEEEVGLSFPAAVAMAIVGAFALLTGLIVLIVCLCKRPKQRKQPVQRDAIKMNGTAKAMNGNGSLPVGSEQEKSLLEIEMDQHASNSSSDGYHAISQTDIDAQQHMQQMQLRQQQQLQQHLHQQQRMMQGSNTYIAAGYDGSRVPETLTRHLMMVDGTQVQQNADGSFYPDLLDIPHRGARGGGSPSTHSGASNDASSQQQLIMTMPLSAAHLAGHPSYGVVHPPLQFTDSSSTTSSTALLIGARPGYVTLPRRPRPRMPSWASSPPPSAGSPAPGQPEEPQQPLYDTIGPRVTADGSSTSALSLNKIAGLTPNGAGLSPRMQASTLSRGHKISLPAYYVPIEEVDIPPASPLVQSRQQHQQSTPNILSNGQYEDRMMGRHHEPVLGYFHNNNSTPIRSDDPETQHLLQDSSTPTSNNTSFSNAPDMISPIPDFRTIGSRASVSSLSSNTGMRRKIAPAVPPKPSGSVVARPASVVPYDDVGPLATGSPVKVAPKPPPKPKKKMSTTSDSGRLDEDGGQAAYEDEGEDGTEV